MNTLDAIFNKHRTDKGSKHGAAHNYASIYSTYLETIRDKELRFLEIGVDFGNSIWAWEEYLPNATIFGADAADKSHLKFERAQTHVLDQNSYIQANELASRLAPLDIVIDDGGHCMNHQQISFGVIFPYLNKNGIYFIEDSHTSNLNMTTCYGQPLKPKGDNDHTINVFRDFQRTGVFNSPYFNKDQNSEIQSMINFVTIFDDDGNQIDQESDEHSNVLRNGVIMIMRK